MFRSGGVTAKNGLGDLVELGAEAFEYVGSPIHHCFQQCGKNRCCTLKRLVLPHFFGNRIEGGKWRKSNGDESVFG
jgi:hypothetical protein